MASQPDRQRLGQLLRPVVEGLGLQLLDLTWVPQRGAAILRLTVDRPGGVTLDECGAASEAVSLLLDRREELLPAHYYLEVSSPGAERFLASEEDFRQALGRKVRLVIGAGETETVLEGRLVAVASDTLSVEGRRPRSPKPITWEVERAQLRSARVLVDV